MNQKQTAGTTLMDVIKRYPWGIPPVFLSALAGAALGAVAYYQHWLG